MLFLLGYGPLGISRIKIGDTDSEDYADVEGGIARGLRRRARNSRNSLFDEHHIWIAIAVVAPWQ